MRPGDPLPDPSLRAVPAGGEPARRARPLLAAIALAAIVTGLTVQAQRYDTCLDAGGTAVACLFAPVVKP